MPTAPPIKLIALDLDGTLLRCDKTISPRCQQAIARALAKNILIILATARPPRSVNLFANALGIQTLQINYNGALIYNPITRSPLAHYPLALHTARQVITLARHLNPDVLVSIEILDRWLTDRLDPTLTTETSKTFPPDLIAPLDIILQTDITKLMLLAPPPQLQTLLTAIESRFRSQVNLAVSDPHLFQIMNPNADKGRALAQIAQHYQISPQNILAIGDAPNDLPMLQYAGHSATVENAWPQVLQAAQHHFPSNNHDGVALAIEHLAL